jgi:hypothetical protein
MKKRAGSFFKNMVNKGKNLFKKEEEEEKEQAAAVDDNGFDSEEDNDIIEVGKSGTRPSQMPGNSFHSSATASAISTSSLSVSGGGVTQQNFPPSSSGLVQTKHLLMEFANNTLLAADNLIHGTN